MNPQEQIALLERKIHDLTKDIQDLNDEFYRNNFTSHQDFNKYANFTSRLKVPVVSALPSNAEIGELVCYSGILYVASALNTWTKVGVQV